MYGLGEEFWGPMRAGMIWRREGKEVIKRSLEERFPPRLWRHQELSSRVRPMFYSLVTRRSAGFSTR